MALGRGESGTVATAFFDIDSVAAGFAPSVPKPRRRVDTAFYPARKSREPRARGTFTFRRNALYRRRRAKAPTQWEI
jgi:hypothetical protein